MTNIIDTVKICQDYFGFNLLSIITEKRQNITKYILARHGILGCRSLVKF